MDVEGFHGKKKIDFTREIMSKLIIFSRFSVKPLIFFSVKPLIFFAIEWADECFDKLIFSL
jgi:hypothetical protein